MTKDITRMTRSARSSFGADWWDEYYIANCVGSQWLVRKYLSPFELTSWSIQGVEVKAKKTGNRTGVPKSATTWVYTLTGNGFTVRVRAVWNGADLLGPLKTHCRVTKVTPDNDGARCAYNAWLRSISAI